MARPRTNLTGMMFGRLLIIRREPTIYVNGLARMRWLGLCDCDRLTVVLQGNLLTGQTRSCGCLQREEVAARRRSHGMCASAEYNAWHSMRQRCLNPNHKAFHHYGGRGIEICERWNSFDNFLADMGRRPGPSYSLDRTDNNRGYGPDNCKWATNLTQQNNRRNNHVLELNGVTMTTAEWSRQTGLQPSLIRTRMRNGWSIERTLTTPVRERRPLR